MLPRACFSVILATEPIRFTRLLPNLIAEIFTQFLSTRDASNSATDIVIRLLPNLSKILKDQRETLIQFAPSNFHRGVYEKTFQMCRSLSTVKPLLPIYVKAFTHRFRAKIGLLFRRICLYLIEGV